MHKSVRDAFVEILKATFIGPLAAAAGNAVSKQSAQHAYDVLVDAEDKGAHFLSGGPQFLSAISLKPTIVANVPREARIRDEETFGPSVSVYIAEDDDEAISIANDSAYGLSAAVHSASWEHAYKVARQLEYGQVHINNMTTGDSRKFVSWNASLQVLRTRVSIIFNYSPTDKFVAGAPIRGVKGSGWGQSNSIWGIEEFSIEKTLVSHPDGASGK